MVIQATYIILLLLLAWAAIGDIRSYRIPNWLVMAVAGLFLINVSLQAALGWPHGQVDILAHLLVGLACFVICAGLFALRFMGGGDAKLIPAVALWAGPQLLAPFLLTMALAGGVVALVVLIRSQANQRKQNMANAETENKKNMVTNKVPYGVGIAAGGLFVTSQLIVNAFGSILA